MKIDLRNSKSYLMVCILKGWNENPPQVWFLEPISHQSSSILLAAAPRLRIINSIILFRISFELFSLI
ncbi:hypothetical protein ACO1NG_14590, partial [Staphylococcus aureus]